jgi:hypothetical protein
LALDYSQVNTFYLQRNRELNIPTPGVLAGDVALRPFFGLRGATGRAAIRASDSDPRRYSGS